MHSGCWFKKFSTNSIRPVTVTTIRSPDATIRCRCTIREPLISAFRALIIACVWTAVATTAVAADRAGSLQEAIEQVQAETGGRILSADTVRAGPREVYRIKVLTPDGRVRVVTKSSRGGRR